MYIKCCRIPPIYTINVYSGIFVNVAKNYWGFLHFWGWLVEEFYV
jgi:hypothetical protein